MSLIAISVGASRHWRVARTCWLWCQGPTSILPWAASISSHAWLLVSPWILLQEIGFPQANTTLWPVQCCTEAPAPSRGLSLALCTGNHPEFPFSGYSPTSEHSSGHRHGSFMERCQIPTRFLSEAGFLQLCHPLLFPFSLRLGFKATDLGM